MKFSCYNSSDNTAKYGLSYNIVSHFTQKGRFLWTNYPKERKSIQILHGI